eukprot:5690985-Amphidinium_carterae.1
MNCLECQRQWENPFCKVTSHLPMNRQWNGLNDMQGKEDGSSPGTHCDVRMTIHGRAWSSIRPAATPGFPGMNRKGDVGGTLTFVTTSMTALVENMCLAACAHGKAVTTSPLESAVAAGTGHVRSIWWHRPAWMAP